jgi:DNA polymerase elongation subunit (family B)
MKDFAEQFDPHKNVTVFDCETTPLPADQLPAFDETQVLVGNLKDPEKIRAKIEDHKVEWMAGAALSPMTGQVAMVGFKSYPLQPLLLHNEESELVKESLVAIGAILTEGNIIAGFNCFSFDLPFLIRRAYRHGIAIPPNIRTRKNGRTYWHPNIVDLREEWLMGDRSPAKGTTVLDAIAKFLGLPAKLGSGKDFAGMTLEQRQDYLSRDLEITEALYRRIM